MAVDKNKSDEPPIFKISDYREPEAKKEPALWIPGGPIGGAVILTIAAIGTLFGLSRSTNKENKEPLKLPPPAHAPDDTENDLRKFQNRNREEIREKFQR